MKRTSIYALSGFLFLLIFVLVIEYFPKKEETRTLKIKGFVKEGEKIEDIEKNGPIDRIEISMKGEKLTLTRNKDGIWQLDNPSYATGDNWKIKQILNLFKDGFSSIYSTKVKKDELHTFGLNEEQRIHLKLYEKGRVWDEFFIGNYEKEEEGYGGDSFISKPADDYVYRIGDKNFKDPFEEGLKTLRDKKVFAMDEKDVEKIKIKNPLEKKFNEIVIESYEVETGEEKKEGEKKKERKWRFAKPAEYAPGEIDSYLRSITTLYAQEFLSKLPEGEDSGIKEGSSYGIELQLKDKKDVKLLIGEVQKDKDYAYARVEGRDEFIKLSKYTAESLMKKFGELRDKTIFGFSKESISKISMNYPDKSIVIAKGKGGWEFLKPEGLYISKSSADSFVDDIARLKCESYVDKSELKGVVFNKNPYTLFLETEGGNYRLIIGEKIKDKSEYYAKREDKEEIFTLPEYIVTRLKKSVDDLRRKEIFEFEEREISEIELHHPDEIVVLQRKKDKEDEWKSVKPQESEKLNQTSVSTLVGTIRNLRVKDFIEGKKEKDVGFEKKDLFKLTVTLKDKSKHILKISSEKKDGDNYALSDEKPFKDKIFTINQYQANNIMKHLQELISQ